MVEHKDRSPMEEAALALYYHAAEMIKAGKNRQEIEQHLIENKGLKPETARLMLDKLDVSRANVARRSGYRNLIMGILLILAVLIMFFTGTQESLPSLVLELVLALFGARLILRGGLQITGL